jgi:hypothetical protein
LNGLSIDWLGVFTRELVAQRDIRLNSSADLINVLATGTGGSSSFLDSLGSALRTRHLCHCSRHQIAIWCLQLRLCFLDFGDL